MSSAFQTSSGTTLAHCGTADTGRENPDIACLIACTWAAVGQKTVNDHNREEMVCALYVNTFALKCVEVFQPGSQALSPFRRDPGSKAGSGQGGRGCIFTHTPPAVTQLQLVQYLHHQFLCLPHLSHEHYNHHH